MTSVAAPVRARTATRPAPARRGAPRTAGTAGTKTRAAQREAASLGRLGAILAIATIGVLVAAVVFHVVLAQRQMQLDRMNVQIAEAQQTYEKHRLAEAMLSSPERIIPAAQELGLVLPAEPATYLQVPGAPLPSASVGEPSTTIDEYGKVKAELADEQP